MRTALFKTSLCVLCVAFGLAASSAWAAFVRWDLDPNDPNQPVDFASHAYAVSEPTFPAYGYDNNGLATPNGAVGTPHELSYRPDPIPAAPISGSISFFGSSMASGPSGLGTTSITFASNWNFVTGTGTYSSILSLTPATFNNFSFTGDGTAVSLTAPVPSLWSLSSGGNSYSFDLLSLGDGHVEQGSIAFTGSGLLHATGFDDTIGSFAMSGTGNDFVYTLSFVTNTAVPEATTLIPVAVLALGAILLELRRRRRATA
jgi:hypothetical protein